jgi:hypothetical protein
MKEKEFSIKEQEQYEATLKADESKQKLKTFEIKYR